MQHSRKGNLYTDIVLEVFRLGGLLIAAGDDMAKNLNLSSARWKVLGALAHADTPMTISQIATSMGQTKQGVQRLSNEMEKDGILAYKPNPYHKTAKLVAITPKGKELYLAMMQKQIPWANSISRGINVKNMEVTLDVLRKIAQRLQP